MWIEIFLNGDCDAILPFAKLSNYTLKEVEFQILFD